MKDIHTYHQFRNEMSYQLFLGRYDIGKVPMHKGYIKYLYELCRPRISYKWFAELCQKDGIDITVKKFMSDRR